MSDIKKASKNSQEKADLSLIPYCAQIAEARAFMVGEKKYGRYNYLRGHKASELVAAIIRHALAWNEGEELDPKDGQPHLGSVKANASMLLKQQEVGTLIDDRYKPEEKQQVEDPLSPGERQFLNEIQLEAASYSELYDAIPANATYETDSQGVTRFVSLKEAGSLSACGNLQEAEENGEKK